jgi:glycosyltransferase involved in cell wall biosynthesis
MLREAVASVRSQTCADFELIIVDDGSRDETASALRGLGDVARVITQAHCGVATARNRGVAAAQGRYLAFLDSDDLWLPEKLATQLAFMTAQREVAICQTEEIWMRRGVRVNPRARHRKPDGDIFKRSLELCLVSPSAVMLTRDLFVATGGFDEALPSCEDYDLWLRVAVHHRVPLLAQPLVIKRGGHQDQLSHAFWGMDRFRVYALEKLLRSGIGGERRRWTIEALAHKVGVLASGARKRGREVEALAYEAIIRNFDRSREGLSHGTGPTQRVRDDAGFSSQDPRAFIELAGERQRGAGAARGEPAHEREPCARSHGLAGRNSAPG